MLSVPKVLHIIEVMDRWAVETWLVRMLEHAAKTGVAVDWTFYGASAMEGSRDSQARSLGAQVIRSPVPIGEKFAFFKALRSEIVRGGYDVLHCHHDLISGIYLLAAAGLPIRSRIVHAHNADESVLTPSALKELVLRPSLRRVCLFLGDTFVGNSDHSLETLVRGARLRPSRRRVHHYGIDPGPFASAQVDRVAFRRSLGIAADAPILVFAGRITREKNPIFAVDVLAALRRRVPQAVGVFAGAGSLEVEVNAHARALGQSDAIRMIGWRHDIPEVMCAGDWFILPHPHEPLEGFGIAIVEAGLAGLRLLLSHGVSDAPILPGAASRRLSLDQGAEAWADAAVELWNGPAPSREDALAALRASRMDMDYALHDLLSLHAERGARP
jgi:glycosyltransferase involved in cell wall biosynthesis